MEQLLSTGSAPPRIAHPGLLGFRRAWSQCPHAPGTLLPTWSCWRPRRPAILPSSRALHRAAGSSSVDVVAAAAWSRPLHFALLITAPGTILMSERPQARPLARKAAARGVSRPVAA